MIPLETAANISRLFTNVNKIEKAKICLGKWLNVVVNTVTSTCKQRQARSTPNLCRGPALIGQYLLLRESYYILYIFILFLFFKMFVVY